MCLNDRMHSLFAAHETIDPYSMQANGCVFFRISFVWLVSSFCALHAVLRCAWACNPRNTHMRPVPIFNQVIYDFCVVSPLSVTCDMHSSSNNSALERSVRRRPQLMGRIKSEITKFIFHLVETERISAAKAAAETHRQVVAKWCDTLNPYISLMHNMASSISMQWRG